jgi:hypothetical protein
VDQPGKTWISQGKNKSAIKKGGSTKEKVVNQGKNGSTVKII